MTETLHQMKMRHKKELQELKKQKGNKKEQKEKEAAMIARHTEEINAKNNTPTDTDAHISEAADSKLNITNDKDKEEKTEEEKGPKLSKSQRRKRNQQLKEEARRKEIEEEVAQMADPKAVENTLFANKLDPEKKTIHEIMADGHCLYRAIEHQIAITTPKKTCGHLELRKSAADYLLDHFGDFCGFVTDNNGNPILEESEYKQYCAQITGTSDIVWGGHVEIQAISHAIQRKITVHSAEGSPLSMGDDDTLPTLHISYHRHWYTLGEHYNSVVTK